MGESTFDPEVDDAFAYKDRVFGVGALTSFYPRLEELQAACPVHAGSISAKFDSVGIDTLRFSEDEQMSVLSYADVDRVLKDAVAFSSSWSHAGLGDVIGRTILEMDPPEHGRYRNLLLAAFSKVEMERWEHDFIRDVVSSYIDKFAAAGAADLASDFAFHFPFHVTMIAVGLPTSDLTAFYRDAVLLTNVAVPEEARRESSARLGDLVGALIEERRKRPQNDLISTLIQARWVDGEHEARLEDDEIVAFARLLIPAGAQTVYRQTTSMLYGLLTNPAQLAALQKDQSLIPRAVEEAMRWEVPLTLIGRTATDDKKIAGTNVCAGTQVNLSLAAANHDPKRWPDPHTFDIFRQQRPHLSFGSGPHICLGQHLARTELRVALELLLDRLPNLRLDPAAGEIEVSGLSFRSVPNLPVLFDPQ